MWRGAGRGYTCGGWVICPAGWGPGIRNPRHRERDDTMRQNPVRGPLEGSPICERCGLKVVRHELARQGNVIHFCDDCYWGVAEEKASSRPAKVAT